MAFSTLLMPSSIIRRTYIFQSMEEGLGITGPVVMLRLVLVATGHAQITGHSELHTGHKW